MIIRNVLFSIGITLFIIGMILTPLPIPFGVPIMLLGLFILIKSSFKSKRWAVSLINKNRHIQKTVNRFRSYGKNRSLQLKARATGQ